MATQWLTAASAALDADNNSTTTNYTWRQLIPSASISNTGNPYTRVTFKASSGEALTLNPVYIGQKADSGDAYDFKAAPVQLLFGGNAGFAIGAGETQVSDSAAFSIPAGKDIIISYYTSGDASHNGFRVKSSMTNWQPYYKSGNDAATQNATGYSAYTANYSLGISLVEAGYDLSANKVTWFFMETLKRKWDSISGIYRPRDLGLVTI